MNELAHLGTLTSLELDMNEDCSRQLDLRFLQALYNLASFVWGDGCAMLTQNQLHIVQQLSSLRSLHCHQGDWTCEEIATLCSSSHRLVNLEHIFLARTEIDEPMMQHLSRLPSLSRLELLRLRLEAFSVLSQCVKLESLSILSQMDAAAHIPALRLAAQACPSLKSLKIRQARTVTGSCKK
jgi:hypothetical protein